MRKKIIFIIIIILAGITLCFAQETVTITSYYPSPYGSYGELTVDKELSNNSSTVTALSVDVNEGGTNLGTVTGLDVDISGVASGTRYAATLMGGNIGIGNSSPSYLLDMESSGGGYYSSSDHQWHNGSSKIIKQDIKPNDMDALKILDNVEIVNYRYKTEVEEYKDAPYHIGFIGEHTPKLLSGRDQNSLATGDCIGLLLALAKAQQQKISELENTLSAIEAKLK